MWFSHFQFIGDLSGKGIQESFAPHIYVFRGMCVYTNVYSLFIYSFLELTRKGCY